MEYLAILGYDCGCFNDANYGFITKITFNANSEEKLNERFEKLKNRKSKSKEGFQCERRTPPIEVIVVDSDFKEVRRFKRDKTK